MSVRGSDCLLHLTNVSVSFEGPSGIIRPIRAFDLQVCRGECVVLAGDSGAGKSTLLHFVAGFLRARRPPKRAASRFIEWMARAGTGVSVEGEVWIRGVDVSYNEPWDRDVGLVMQRFNLYPHMSIASNLAFPLQVRNIPSKERIELVQDVAGRLGIGRELPKRPAQLSGGQQQRVAIGKALLRDPAVILLDEPFSHLDIRWRRLLREVLRKEVLGENRCILLVSHDLEDARMADRIVMFERPNESFDTELRVLPENGKGLPGSAWVEFEDRLARRLPLLDK